VTTTKHSGPPGAPAGPPVAGRATRQRAAVAAALEEVDEFRSAQDLHDILKHRGDSVGLTTVYRTLQSLADAGEIDVLRTGEGESVYRRCSGGGHHHHLVCRSCGKAVEVEGPAVERWAEAVAAEHGFVDVAHTVEIFGTCQDCADAQRAAAQS
jgi:Fur family ferric uptake transcriptional regulator